MSERLQTGRNYSSFERVSDKARFLAYLSAPNLNQLSAAPMSYPKRVLHALGASFLVPGNVVTSRDGETFLLSNYPQVFKGSPSFRAYQLTESLTWFRPTKTTDTVTGLEKQTGASTNMGPLLITKEPMREEEFLAYNVAQAKFASGQAVQVGDLVAGSQVKRVTFALGIYFVDLA